MSFQKFLSWKPERIIIIIITSIIYHKIKYIYML